MLRWVLDTNVIASVLLWGGAPRTLLEAGRIHRVELFTSIPLLRELTGILERKKFTAKIQASGMSIEDLVDSYSALASVVRPFEVPRIAPDPDDDIVIGAALGARANAIVTGDVALLSILEYRGVSLIRVADAIKSLDQ